MTPLAQQKGIPEEVFHTRAPYQVLVFPYYIQPDGTPLFALFKREDLAVWHGVGGGGELGETPLDSAKAEAREEAGILPNSKFTQLNSMAYMPVTAIAGFVWGPEIPVIPEYSFGVEVKTKDIKLSFEHTEYKWFCYKDACERLNWVSNKTSLFELDYRITHDLLDRVVGL